MQQALELQKNILKYYHLDQIITSKNIYYNQKQWMHCHIAGQKDKTKMIMLHGFGGNGLLYIHMFKKLSDKYNIYSIDTPGTGLSSRTPYQAKKIQQSIDYFTNKINSFIKNITQATERIVLVGHSFGGFLAAKYAQSFPNKIKKLILLSPMGVNQITQQQLLENQKIFQQQSFFIRLRLKLMRAVYNFRITPAGVFNNCIIGNKVLKQVLTSRLGMSQQQQQMWRNYMKAASRIQGGSSQQALYDFLDFPMINKHPTILYGSHDWMYQYDGSRFNSKNKQKIQTNQGLKLQRVNQSGHQLMFQNPQQVTNLILQNQ